MKNLIQKIKDNKKKVIIVGIAIAGVAIIAKAAKGKYQTKGTTYDVDGETIKLDSNDFTSGDITE